jgi:hypothetical protein
MRCQRSHTDPELVEGPFTGSFATVGRVRVRELSANLR